MKTLHLIDSLAYHGSARQLQLLAPAQADAEVCCLGADTPWSAGLRQAGVSVHTLGWTRWLDFSALLYLREVVRGLAPKVIHVWRMPALRALAVIARDLLPRTVMSAPLPAKGKLAWWDRKLLQQVRCLALAGVSDQERCVQQGIVRPLLRVVAPAIPEKRCQDPFIEKGPDSFLIGCVGNLEREEGFRQAVWAFDLIRQAHAAAHLHIVGAGSQLASLRALAVGLEDGMNVHFLGAQADATKTLSDADVVWIPSQANCGRQVALEAMAAGRAVVASDVPCLREIIRDGDTGYLVPVGDPMLLARRTFALCRDQSLRECIGAAARQCVRQQFPLGAALERSRDVYRSVAA